MSSTWSNLSGWTSYSDPLRSKAELASTLLTDPVASFLIQTLPRSSMELVANARHEDYIGAPRILCKSHKPSRNKENQPRLEGRTLPALCKALSLSDGQSCSADLSDLSTTWDASRPSPRSEAALLTKPEDAFSETFGTTWTGREFLSSARFLSGTKGHGPVEISKQSGATRNSKSKRPVKQKEGIAGIGSDHGAVICSYVAPPPKAQGAGRLTLDLVSSNFDAPQHAFHHVVQDVKSHLKVSSPHPMSPLAEVTEAYTETQGGWRLARETRCFDSGLTNFSQTLNSGLVTFGSSKNPEIMRSKGKTTKAACAVCKTSKKHLGLPRGRQVLLNPPSPHGLPLPTASSFLRI